MCIRDRRERERERLEAGWRQLEVLGVRVRENGILEL